MFAFVQLMSKFCTVYFAYTYAPLHRFCACSMKTMIVFLVLAFFIHFGVHRTFLGDVTVLLHGRGDGQVGQGHGG